MKSKQTNIRQVSHNSKEHQAHNPKEGQCRTHTDRNGSAFENFIKPFFEGLSAKDRLENEVYMNMKSVDASKDINK